MSIKYLVALQLKSLSDDELDKYATKMMELQIDILDSIDVWTDNYNLVADEYLIRRSKESIIIKNDSETKH